MATASVWRVRCRLKGGILPWYTPADSGTVDVTRRLGLMAREAAHWRARAGRLGDQSGAVKIPALVLPPTVVPVPVNPSKIPARAFTLLDVSEGLGLVSSSLHPSGIL